MKEEDLIVIIRHCNNNFDFERLICNVFNLFLNLFLDEWNLPFKNTDLVTENVIEEIK